MVSKGLGNLTPFVGVGTKGFPNSFVGAGTMFRFWSPSCVRLVGRNALLMYVCGLCSRVQPLNFRLFVWLGSSVRLVRGRGSVYGFGDGLAIVRSRL